MKTKVFVDHVATPVGKMRLVVDEAGVVRGLDWDVDGDLPDGCVAAKARDPSGVASVLGAYFAGRVDAIDALAVDEAAGTEFQRRVWRALRQIPVGRTESYAGLARRIGAPRAVRAVGSANHCNPVAIVVPCHRVIGSDGSLTGYAGGLERRELLLKLEGALDSSLLDM